MLLRLWLVACVLAIALGGVSRSLAQAPAAGQLTYVEQMVTSYRPVQKRVVVPVVEYRDRTRLQAGLNPTWVTERVPVTRWEERIETTYAPQIRREYRPVLQTSLRQGPPLRLAQRPQPAGNAARPVQYDQLPMVAVQPRSSSTARTAQQPAAPAAQSFRPGR